MANESTSYSGPETNEVYSDTETYETFDDLDEETDDEQGNEDDSPQSGTSYEDAEHQNGEEEDEAPKKSAKLAKKEADKKQRGQKGDDMDTLEREDSFDDLDDDEEETEEEEDEEEGEEKPKAEEVKPAEEVKDGKKEKIKPTYVEIDGETYALNSNAIISVPVDGKTEKVSLQELKNNYSGKVFHDKRINEVNILEQGVKRRESDITQKLSHFNTVKKQIDEIIADETKNPKDALKIFLDSAGVDSYDLMERVFKADLTELANVLNMEPAERKAYFLEKKNSHLLEQSKKRIEREQSDQRVTSYTQKVNALRNSFGVSEAQYVDALEELKTFGTPEKDISEQDIVEWAATKPHRPIIHNLLLPYKDQLPEGSFGDLAWKLTHILREGKETAEVIKKNLANIYGTPTEVKELSKKLNPLGRKSKVPAKIMSPKKGKFESFDDIDDD